MVRFANHLATATIAILASVVPLMLGGCLSFARIDGARTVAPRGASAALILGGDGASGEYALDDAACDGVGQPQCGTGEAEPSKYERRAFGPSNQYAVIQVSGRTGLFDRVDCGGAVSFLALGADCKWNWFRTEGFAVATSLGGTGSFAHYASRDGTYKLLTAENRVPMEAWFPFGASGNSLVLIVEPFGGYYWKKIVSPMRNFSNTWERAPFAGLESFVGVDLLTPGRAFTFRVGGLAWYAKPFGFASPIAGAGVGTRFQYNGPTER